MLRPTVEERFPLVTERYEIPDEEKRKVERINGITFIDYILIGGGTASYHAMQVH